MTEINRFVASVPAQIPQYFPDRGRITSDLTAHLTESVSAGIPIDEAIRRMGTPDVIAAELTQGYAPSLAPYLRRLGAFFVDIIVFLPLAVTARCISPFRCVSISPFRMLLLFVGALVLVCVIPEWLTGRTPGKALFDLRVQGVNGNSISLGQAVLRRVSWYGLFWAVAIDGVFVLGTQRRQRLTDLLAKTVVVTSTTDPRPRWQVGVGWLGALMVLGILSWCLYPAAVQAWAHLHF